MTKATRPPLSPTQQRLARRFVALTALRTGIEWALWLGLLVWWVDVLDFSPLQLILLGVVLEITVLVSETPTGVVADLYSRKWSVFIAMVLMAISYVWAVASTDFWVLLPAQALFGFGWTFASGADIAWLTDEMRGVGPADDRSIELVLLQRHRWGIAAGLVFVPLMMILGRPSIRLALVMTGVLTFAVAIAWAAVIPERHFSPQREHSDFMTTLRAGLQVVRGRPSLRILVVVLILEAFASEAIDRFGWKRFIDAIDSDRDSVVITGALFLLTAIAGLIANNLVTSWIRRRPEGIGLTNPMIGLAIALLAVATVGTFVTAIAGPIALIGFGLMLQDSVRESAHPVAEAWTNREAPSEVRATVHSLTGQAMATGQIIGGLALGAVAEAAGISSSIVIAAGLLALAAGVATRAW